MKDYKNLIEIEIHSQKELDEIPLDYKGRIYIKDAIERIIVKNAYYLSVVAYDNSSVEAYDNVQVLDRLYNRKIQISGNARIVYMPKTIDEFMDFYNIKHTKTKAIFFKAVHKQGDEYISDYDKSFKYEIGKNIKNNCDIDTDKECSYGIHISTLQFALDFGRNWEDIAILECETKISDIVLPNDSDGKVRTSHIKVLREVPLEECGLYGKIIAKRLKK